MRHVKTVSLLLFTTPRANVSVNNVASIVKMLAVGSGANYYSSSCINFFIKWGHSSVCFLGYSEHYIGCYVKSTKNSACSIQSPE
jgi:hypothetical protein